MARGNWRSNEAAGRGPAEAPRKKRWVNCPRCGKYFDTTTWTPRCKACKTKFKFWFITPFRKEYQILEEGK
jgi:hypothetical protein